MEYRALIPRAPSVSWIKPAAATREPEFSIAHCLEMLENKELLVLARQATAAALRTAVHWEMTPPEILAALATREQRMEQQKQEYAQRLARLRQTIAWDDMPAEIHALILADMDLLTRARLRLTERTLLQCVPSLPYGWHAMVPRNPRRFRELVCALDALGLLSNPCILRGLRYRIISSGHRLELLWRQKWGKSKNRIAVEIMYSEQIRARVLHYKTHWSNWSDDTLFGTLLATPFTEYVPNHPVAWQALRDFILDPGRFR